MTSGKSMSYHATVGGGSTRKTRPSNPAPKIQNHRYPGGREMKRRTRSSSVLARTAMSKTLDLRVNEFGCQHREPAQVVAHLGDDVVGHGVAEEWARETAVEGSPAECEKQALLRGREGRKRDAHGVSHVAGVKLRSAHRLGLRARSRSPRCGNWRRWRSCPRGTAGR